MLFRVRHHQISIRNRRMWSPGLSAQATVAHWQLRRGRGSERCCRLNQLILLFLIFKIIQILHTGPFEDLCKNTSVAFSQHSLVHAKTFLS